MASATLSPSVTLAIPEARMREAPPREVRSGSDEIGTSWMKPAIMKLSLAILVASLGVGVADARAEDLWQVRGDVVAVKPGAPEIVVLRLSDGRTVELPIDSLSGASQATARKVAAALSPVGDDGEGVVTVRGPFGRSVRVGVPELIKDIEGDAIHCRTAADAADVYRLALAGDRLSPERRAAAESRLREWAALAAKDIVRLGDRWVSTDEAQAAAEEAGKVVAHALEIMRLGNADLAEEELRKAARVDPEEGRPSFVMGLSYAVVAKNPSKAVEHFADVVRRDPANAAALNDLAVLEILTRRYASAVEHFRDALAWAADPRPVADNVAWAVKLAGAAKINPALTKSRMPDKIVDDLNELYRTLTQELKLKPADAVSAPTVLGPGGDVCSAATLADVARLFESAVSPAPRRSLGFVVAPGRVVCPRGVVLADDGSVRESVAIELPSAPGRRLTATVVAAPEEADVALLACDALDVEPLPLAKAMSSRPEVRAVERAADSWLAPRPTAVRGTVLAPVLEVQAKGRFVHTAVVPRGLGGGPIVDANGQVVGMVAPTPRTEASGNAAGFGVSVNKVLNVMEEGGLDSSIKSDTIAASNERRAIAATLVVSAEPGQSSDEQ